MVNSKVKGRRWRVFEQACERWCKRRVTDTVGRRNCLMRQSISALTPAASLRVSAAGTVVCSWPHVSIYAAILRKREDETEANRCSGGSCGRRDVVTGSATGSFYVATKQFRAIPSMAQLSVARIDRASQMRPAPKCVDRPLAHRDGRPKKAGACFRRPSPNLAHLRERLPRAGRLRVALIPPNLRALPRSEA